MESLQLAKMIDATLLNANATYEQIESLCKDAAANDVWSVCVNPVHVKRARRIERQQKCSKPDRRWRTGRTKLTW